MSRRHLFFLAKLAIAGLLLAWLVWRGTLDFGKLAIFFERPSLLVGNLVVFAGTYVLSAIRWRLLLSIAGIQLSFARAVQLTFVGAFFNVVAPGNIGGEVLKAIYVARDVAPERRPAVYLVAFLDRLVALAGLVGVAVVLNLGVRVTSGDSRFGEATTAIVVLAVVTLGLPIAALMFVRRYRRKGVEEAPANPSRIVTLRVRLVAAARLVSNRPGALTLALCLSIAIHVASIMWFSVLASAVLEQHVSVTQMVAVYPLGMLSVLLPVSYAGFGVGQVAFEQLFLMVGLTGGANVITVHLVGQIVPCLFGVIPYVLLKRDAGPPNEAELLREGNR